MTHRQKTWLVSDAKTTTGLAAAVGGEALMFDSRR